MSTHHLTLEELLGVSLTIAFHDTTFESSGDRWKRFGTSMALVYYRVSWEQNMVQGCSTAHWTGTVRGYASCPWTNPRDGVCAYPANGYSLPAHAKRYSIWVALILVCYQILSGMQTVLLAPFGQAERGFNDVVRPGGAMVQLSPSGWTKRRFESRCVGLFFRSI